MKEQARPPADCISILMVCRLYLALVITAVTEPLAPLEASLGLRGHNMHVQTHIHTVNALCIKTGKSGLHVTVKKAGIITKH